MAWTAPKTWTAVVVTVADLNTHIRDNELYLKAAVDAVQVDHGVCQGRLTLTTGVPVTTADVLAATTLRYAPYKGNLIALYSGTAWALYSFPELSIAVPATTSQMYDVFVYDNAGTRTLELLAWTNDTTRATALVTQDGVLCKSTALTRRYVGSFRTTTVSGQTEDSYAKRFVWNYANRVGRILRVFESTDTWTYTTAAWRQANGSTANQVALVVGVSEVVFDGTLQVGMSSASGGVHVAASLREDSVGQPAATSQFCPVSTVIGNFHSLTAHLVTMPTPGYHTYIWQEYSVATGTTTWYGDAGGANTGPNSGILATIQG